MSPFTPSLFKRSSGGFTSTDWDLSAPFMYVVRLGERVQGSLPDAGHPLDEKGWLEVLANILPTARHIFLEGENPLGHPGIFSILDFLQSWKGSFSIRTDGQWGDGDELLLKLQKYSRLEKIRFSAPSPVDGAAARKFRSNLEKTIAAGIVSELIIPPDAAGYSQERMTELLSTGIARISFPFGHKHEGDSTVNLQLFHEACAPISFREESFFRCPAGEGLAFVDPWGNLAPCPDGPCLGSLREEPVEELWKSRIILNWRKRRERGDGCRSLPGQSPSPSSGPPVNLDSELIPFPLFEPRMEKFGAILIRGYDYLPVSAKGLKILAMMDGSHTVGDIHRRFGSIGLSLAFGLFARNMLRFERPVPAPSKESEIEAEKVVSPLNETEEGADSPPLEELPSQWFCRTLPNLYISRRDGKQLVVEPESASWCIFSQKESEILDFIERTGGAPVGDIYNTSDTGKENITRLILLLFQRNMISINGKTYFNPAEMWKSQKYPHYFNLHMTEACNLACSYCRINSIPAAPLMTPELCRSIIRRILEEIPNDSVIISFHGGEPLLNLEAITAGAEEARRSAAETGKRVKLVMQTNATLLTAEAAGVLKENGVEIGVSLDGCRDIHDSRRIYHGGAGTHADVVRGIRTAGDEGVPVGYLAVVHEPQDYLPVLDYLAIEMGAYSPRINHSAYDGRGKEELAFPVDRAAAFAREWLKLVDYAEEFHGKTGKWLSIADLNLFIFHLVSKVRPHMCYRSPCGIGNSILGFAPDGKIYLCDEMVGNSDFLVGDIHDLAPLGEMLDGSALIRTAMAERRVENIPRCSSCTWKRFHGGGCASKTFSYFGTLNREDPMCRFYEVVFEELMWRLAEKPHLLNLCGCYREQLDMDHAMNYLQNGLEGRNQ